MRSKARTFGRFSSREIVDCEHNSRSDGDRSSAILNIGSLFVAVLVAGADHQEPKTNDIGQAVRDLIGIAWVHDAGGEPVGEAKALFDFAQRQNAAIRRKQTAIKFDNDGLPA